MPAAPTTSTPPADVGATTAETDSAGQEGSPSEPGDKPGATTAQERP